MGDVWWVDVLEPERASELSRTAWVRSEVGVRGDSGAGLVVNLDEPWLMRIFGGAEEDGKEGGARSEAAIAIERRVPVSDFAQV